MKTFLVPSTTRKLQVVMWIILLDSNSHGVKPHLYSFGVNKRKGKGREESRGCSTVSFWSLQVLMPNLKIAQGVKLKRLLVPFHVQLYCDLV